jgi:hypothetical protein
VTTTAPISRGGSRRTDPRLSRAHETEVVDRRAHQATFKKARASRDLTRRAPVRGALARRVRRDRRALPSLTSPWSAQARAGLGRVGRGSGREQPIRAACWSCPGITRDGTSPAEIKSSSDTPKRPSRCRCTRRSRPPVCAPGFSVWPCRRVCGTEVLGQGAFPSGAVSASSGHNNPEDKNREHSDPGEGIADRHQGPRPPSGMS